MILYQLAINGITFGKPMPEYEVDRVISKSRSGVSGELEKVAVVPELKIVGGVVPCRQ